MKRTQKTILKHTQAALCALLLCAFSACGTQPENAPPASQAPSLSASDLSSDSIADSPVDAAAPPSQAVQPDDAAAPYSPEGWQDFPQADAQGGEGDLLGVYHPKYAKGFTIEYYSGGAKIIATDIEATANTAASAQRVLIVPQGAAAPPDAVYDARIDGGLTRAVAMASSHAGHFANLDATAVVLGTSIEEKNCYIPSLKSALQSGAAQYVGSGKKADKELIASLQPQVVFIGGMQSDVELAKKLEESGIFCFYFGDFAEQDFMGRAEWIELIGAMMGREVQAQQFMKGNEAAVREITGRIAAIEDKPRVLWFTHNSQAPHWNVRTSLDYVNSMVSAVGAEMYYPQGTEENAIKLSNEAFLPLMLEADKIVFGVSLNSYPDAQDIRFFNKEGQIDFTASKAYQNGGCFVVGYTWAQDTANVQSIIASLAAAFYPEEFGDLDPAGKILPFYPQG